MSRYAVLIVNYRAVDHTTALLDALGGEPDEVVVVDNASGDGSVEQLRARHPGARIVERRTNDGFAAGVNAGMAATTAPVVVLLNPDTQPSRAALAAMVAHLDDHPRAGVVAPRLVHADGSPQPSFYRRFPNLAILFIELCLPLGNVLARIPGADPYRVPDERLRDGLPIAHAIGAALAIRRTAYEAAGPLDEGFFLYLEETDWQERVRRAGYEVHALPSAEVVHLVRGGEEEALAPSPHFLASTRRYLELRGRSRRVVDAAITVALALSRVGARAERLVVAPDRRTSGERATAYDALWRAR